MANPLTFLVPFRYDGVRRVLLVQSGPINLALEVAERLSALFSHCEIDALVREEDCDAARVGRFARVTAVRWEDRFEMVRRLRRQRYDAVVALASSRGSDYLRLIPFLLRTRVIFVFNDRLDYFPLHVTRLAALAHHLSGQGSVGALVAWTLWRAALLPLVTVVLVGSAARLYLRAAWRRSHA